MTQHYSTWRKTFTWLLGVAFLLAAHGSAQDAPTGQKLTVWYLSVDPPAFVDLFQRWADKTGNEVELVSMPSDGFENAILTRWAAGERPDILEWHGGASAVLQLNPEENLQDLSDMDYIATAPVLYPTLGTVNGRTYAAVTSFPQVFGLYYNKKVLADAGIEPPQSFADLFAACETLKEKAPGVVPIWENGGSVWPPQILPAMYMADIDDSYQQSILNKEATLDDPDGAWVAALTAYYDLMNNGCFSEDITTATFENGMTVVAEGGAAMIALPPFADLWNERFGGDAALADSTIGVVFPAKDGPSAWWIPSPTGTYYAPKTGDANREAAALDFIRYATGEGYQQTIDESQTFPVMEGFENPGEPQELTLALKEIYDTNSGLPWNSSFPPGVDGGMIMGTIISGQATPVQAALTTQLQLEQGAKAAKLPGW
jgi:raffinose/stachyose/melibiose transport system substrate-binding protein